MELRMSGIGGSDASTVCGVNPYKTSYELYLEKTGQIECDDLSDNQAVHFGNVLEDVVATEYASRTQQNLRRCNQFIRDDEMDFLIANIDRDVVGSKRILECKTAGQYMSNDWGPGCRLGDDGSFLSFDDGVPMPYLMQVTHYMAVCKVPEADLAVLIGGRDFRVYRLTFDADLWASMLRQYMTFWMCVESLTPPDPDMLHRSMPDLLNRIHPSLIKRMVFLDDSADTWATVLDEAEEKIAAYKKVVDGAKLHIRWLTGDSHCALTPEGRLFEEKVVLRKGYTVASTDVRTFKEVKGDKTKEKLVAHYLQIAEAIEGEAE